MSPLPSEPETALAAGERAAARLRDLGRVVLGVLRHERGARYAALHRWCHGAPDGRIRPPPRDARSLGLEVTAGALSPGRRHRPDLGRPALRRHARLPFRRGQGARSASRSWPTRWACKTPCSRRPRPAPLSAVATCASPGTPRSPSHPFITHVDADRAVPEFRYGRLHGGHLLARSGPRRREGLPPPRAPREGPHPARPLLGRPYASRREHRPWCRA